MGSFYPFLPGLASLFSFPAPFPDGFPTENPVQWGKSPEETVGMKEKLKNSPALQKWFYTQSPLVITRPALRETARCLGYLLMGFVLSCGVVAARPAPFALGLLASAGGGLTGLCCLLGAAAGYLTMQPFAQGLEQASAGILIFVCSYIFGGLWVSKRRWFPCLVGGVMTGAVGLIFLLSQPITAALLGQFLLTVALSGLTPLCYAQLLSEKKRSAGSLLALGSFLLGGAAISLYGPLRLGPIVAVALVAVAIRRADLGTAAALAVGGGVFLDLALETGGFWTLCLGGGCCVGALLPRQKGLLRWMGFLAVAAAGMVYAGEYSQLCSLALGAVLSLLLPGGLIAGREESAVFQSAQLAEERLRCGQNVLRQLYDAIGLDPAAREDQEKSRVFDKAAAKVCRRCTGYSHCWEKNAQETYQLLLPVLHIILERGEVRREDFPQEFAETCRHLEGMVVAVNQELDSIVCRSQWRCRNQEQRILVSRTLLLMSRLLEQDARVLRTDQYIPQEAYRVQLGVAAKGRHGARLSGDRGASLHTQDGKFYVILCDGVGTGNPAAQESLLAVDTLVSLLQAGMPPEDAMELLNGMYILRDSGSFSTMDVLELSLLSGQGTLYKWGAAPSYIRSGNTVKRLGTAAPPPGLGVGGSCGAEVLRLSLWSGDLLVLVSDGVVREETEVLLRDFSGDNVKNLAAALVSKAQELGGEDDMTAAVVRLQDVRP
jgi:stage II sporulation protein E